MSEPWLELKFTDGYALVLLLILAIDLFLFLTPILKALWKAVVYE